MPTLTTCPKIQNFIHKTLTEELPCWLSLLVSGDFRGYEASVSSALGSLYNYLCQELVPLAADSVSSGLIAAGQAAGGRNIEVRPLCLRLATGHCIYVQSPYVKATKQPWSGSRHLLVNHWSIIGGATPGLYDKVGYCSALGPRNTS